MGQRRIIRNAHAGRGSRRGRRDISSRRCVAPVKKTEQSSDQTAPRLFYFKSISSSYRLPSVVHIDISNVKAWNFRYAPGGFVSRSSHSCAPSSATTTMPSIKPAARPFRADNQHRIDSRHASFDKGQTLKAVGMRPEMV
jgi:hypothetical protein